MRDKINKFLDVAPMYQVYLASTLVTFIFSFGIFFIMESMMGAIEPTGFNMVAPIVISLLMSLVIVLMIGTMRQSDEFFKITQPLMERAEACETKEEWEAIGKDIVNFHKTHKLGTFNTGYLNKIFNVLKIKKPYMK